MPMEEDSALLCRGPQPKDMKQWFNCCWRMEQMSMHKEDITAMLCRGDQSKDIEQWLGCYWKTEFGGARMFRVGNYGKAASAMGNERVLRLLLEKGAKVNVQRGKYGNAVEAASDNNRGCIAIGKRGERSG